MNMIAYEPCVSVYIPTYNRTKLLERAVNSVLSQTYKNIEIIVVDDASNDSTWLMLKSFEKSNVNIKIYRNSCPSGAPKARNKAIHMATGIFITGLDDDDYFTPDRIESFVKIWNEQYSFLCGSVFHKTETGLKEKNYGVGEIDWDDIRTYNLVGNQVFTKKDRLISVGGFDETLKAWQDYDLWLRLIKQYGTALKINKSTYIVDKTHDLNRISSSKERVQMGYSEFVLKHKADLTEAHIALQFINYCSNTNIRPSLKDYFALKYPESTPRLNKLYLRSYFPFISRLLVGVKKTLVRTKHKII